MEVSNKMTRLFPDAMKGEVRILDEPCEDRLGSLWLGVSQGILCGPRYFFSFARHGAAKVVLETISCIAVFAWTMLLATGSLCLGLFVRPVALLVHSIYLGATGRLTAGGDQGANYEDRMNFLSGDAK